MSLELFKEIPAIQVLCFFFGTLVGNQKRIFEVGPWNQQNGEKSTTGAEPERTNRRNTSWEAHVTVFDCDFIRVDQLCFCACGSHPADLCSHSDGVLVLKLRTFSDSAAAPESCLV